VLLELRTDAVYGVPTVAELAALKQNKNGALPKFFSGSERWTAS